MTISYESLVDTLFDRMPMGVVVFDRDGRIVRLNPTWIEFAEGLAGRPMEGDLIGRTAPELFPETVDFAQEVGDKVMAGETIRLESLPDRDVAAAPPTGTPPSRRCTRTARSRESSRSWSTSPTARPRARNSSSGSASAPRRSPAARRLPTASTSSSTR